VGSFYPIFLSGDFLYKTCQSAKIFALIFLSGSFIKPFRNPKQGVFFVGRVQSAGRIFSKLFI
jgi:hypothetical protein